MLFFFPFFVAYEKFEISCYFPSTLLVLRLAELFLATLKTFRSMTQTPRTLEQTLAGQQTIGAFHFLRKRQTLVALMYLVRVLIAVLMSLAGVFITNYFGYGLQPLNKAVYLVSCI